MTTEPAATYSWLNPFNNPIYYGSRYGQLPGSVRDLAATAQSIPSVPPSQLIANQASTESILNQALAAQARPTNAIRMGGNVVADPFTAPYVNSGVLNFPRPVSTVPGYATSTVVPDIESANAILAGAGDVGGGTRLLGLLRASGAGGEALGAGRLAGAARVGGPAALGTALALGANTFLPPSKGRQVFSDVAQGAGIGGSIGALGLPIPLVGELTTAGGAVVGGALGGIIGLLHNGGGKSVTDQIHDVRRVINSNSTLTDQSKQNLIDGLNTALALETTDEGRKQVLANAKSSILTQIATDQQTQLDTQRMLAGQALAQQFLSPTVQGIMDTADQQAALTARLAGTLPTEFRGPALLQAAQNVAGSRRTAAAYQNQLLTAGPVNTLNDLVQQAQQTTLGGIVQQYNGTGGGSSGFSDILANAAVANATPTPNG